MLLIRRNFSRTLKYCQETIKSESIVKTEVQVPKQPLYKRLGEYVLRIANDYKMVFEEVGTTIKEKKIKSGLCFSLLAATIYSVKTNPMEEDFRKYLVESSNELLLLGDPIRNTRSDAHMQNIWKCYNVGQMKRLSLGICSFMWVDNYANETGLFKARCYPLKVGWLDMPERVVDIGAFGKWWWIEKAMIDYDIKEEDWENSSESIRNN